jgi:Zn-finger nucleic acid-binding protein
MNCPRCSATPLTQQKIDDLTIDRCPNCHGLWLDALELERLLELKPRDLLNDDSHVTRSSASSGRLNCPVCKGTYLIKLNSLHRPGTILDSCTVCFGTWLDAGELARLAGSGLAAKIRSFFGGA